MRVQRFALLGRTTAIGLGLFACAPPAVTQDASVAADAILDAPDDKTSGTDDQRDPGPRTKETADVPSRPCVPDGPWAWSDPGLLFAAAMTSTGDGGWAIVGVRPLFKAPGPPTSGVVVLDACGAVVASYHVGPKQPNTPNFIGNVSGRLAVGGRLHGGGAEISADGELSADPIGAWAALQNGSADQFAAAGSLQFSCGAKLTTIRRVVPTAEDRAILLLSCKHPPSDEYGGSYSELRMLSWSGAVDWSFQPGFPVGVNDLVPQGPDLLITGSRLAGFNARVWMARISPLGFVIVQTEGDANPQGSMLDIASANDGTYWATGSGAALGAGPVVKFDAKGQVERLQYAFPLLYGTAVNPLPDGGAVVVGRAPYGDIATGGTVVVARVDALVRAVWWRDLPHETLQSAAALGIDATSGIVVAGHRYVGQPLKPIAAVARLDAWGNHSAATSGPCSAFGWNACLDPNPCTLDHCDAAHNGCYHVDLPDGTTCTLDGKTCKDAKCGG